MPIYRCITTMKHKAVSLLATITLLALVAPAINSTASAQTGSGDNNGPQIAEVFRQSGSSSPIAGSWILTNERINQGVSFTAVGSFTAGGVVLFTGSIGAVPPLLHGSWERTGFNRFDSTVYFFAFDPTGKAVAMIKTNQVFQLNSRDELVPSCISQRTVASGRSDAQRPWSIRTAPLSCCRPRQTCRSLRGPALAR